MAAPPRPTDAAETLTVLCRALRAEVEDLADVLTARIVEREDVYAELGVPVDDDLRPTCRASLDRLLTLLAGDLPPGVDAAARTVDTGRRRARQGVPLEVVLRAYRQCGRLVWERMRDVSRARFDGGHDAALLVAADDVWGMLDASSDRLVDAYRQEEARLRGNELGRRWAVLEGLLAGRGHDPVVARDAARLLDVPQDAELICVVAPTDEVDDPLPAPAEALAAVAPSYWHARSAEIVGVIVPGDDAAAALPRVVEGLTRHTAGPIGVSPPVRGPGRLDVAHRWARLAVGTLPAGSTGVVTLDERLPEALLAGTPDLVPRLRRVALRDLLDLPDRDRDTLLVTLRAVLDADGSPSRAAAVLYCHRNTVMYRLGRIESLTGRRLADARDRLLLGLALLAPADHSSNHQFGGREPSP
ncbi:PucR family transcriptional regulator [Actinomycetospora termitidis]|uniref:Helix-turn-helix domain-containing protein n=1 Tax=Actinomycetospora termitidis TaxID=3053470 RepID=A0ABT7MGL9_9PSEU|nr:helix-turn-helix domain-containing protein [Actinomycetospora sp. Odt1-22]MDL5159832.1 helix-turn-helix domain-containing protein [Actinomycetospora sp. Odt1-22]